MGTPAEHTARQRSLDAELATDAVKADNSPETNQHAVTLHKEAARWCREAGANRRAHRHEMFAKVHAQAAAKILEAG